MFVWRKKVRFVRTPDLGSKPTSGSYRQYTGRYNSDLRSLSGRGSRGTLRFWNQEEEKRPHRRPLIHLDPCSCVEPQLSRSSLERLEDPAPRPRGTPTPFLPLDSIRESSANISGMLEHHART